MQAYIMQSPHIHCLNIIICIYGHPTGAIRLKFRFRHRRRISRRFRYVLRYIMGGDNNTQYYTIGTLYCTETGIVNIWSSVNRPRREELSELQDFCISIRQLTSYRKSIYTFICDSSHTSHQAYIIIIFYATGRMQDNTKQQKASIRIILIQVSSTGTGHFDPRGTFFLILLQDQNVHQRIKLSPTTKCCSQVFCSDILIRFVYK